MGSILWGRGRLLTRRRSSKRKASDSHLDLVRAPYVLYGVKYIDLVPLAPSPGMQPGEVLILTKAVGTGTIFASEMRMKAQATWISGAIASMVMSNRKAALCLQAHGVRACHGVSLCPTCNVCE